MSPHRAICGLCGLCERDSIIAGSQRIRTRVITRIERGMCPRSNDEIVVVSPSVNFVLQSCYL